MNHLLHFSNSSENEFYKDEIINYSCISEFLKIKYKQEIFELGIDNYQTIVIYLQDQKLLMPILIILDELCLNIHLANRSIYDRYQKNNKSADFIISDISLPSDRFPLREWKLLGTTVYVYKNRDRQNEFEYLEDTKFVFYTSGTTGTECEVAKSKETLVREALAIVETLDLTSQDTILCNTSVFHAYGQAYGVFAACLAGARVRYLPAFVLPMHIINALQTEKFNILISTPYYYNMIYHELLDVKDMRYMLSSGGKLSDKVINSKLKINNAYGSTETGAIAIQRYERGGDSSYVGTPIKGVQILMDEVIMEKNGQKIYQLKVKSDYMYDYKKVNGHVEKFQSLYYQLGDIGYIDDDGNLNICGRIDSIINLNGGRISTDEIEKIIQQCEYVDIAKVVKEKDQKENEYLVAYATVKKDCEPSQIKAYCQQNLDYNKIPRHIFIVKEFKFSESGKIVNLQNRKNGEIV